MAYHRQSGPPRKSREPHPRAKPRPHKSTPRPAAPPTDWGEVAEWYDQLVGDTGSEYHQKVILPGVLRLMAVQAGEQALDLACGQGVLSRLLAERGADVKGVDAADELIRAARERGPETIRYIRGDARNLSFLSAGRFAAAACVLAIQNIHPIPPVFQSVHRVLRPGGRLVLVMMHPCFRGLKETSWGWDESTGVKFRRVDRYLLPRKSPVVTHPGEKSGEYTWTFHRPIEAYVRALRNAGLLIDSIEEWPSHKISQPGPRSAAENSARSEIPLFMAIRAIKAAPITPTAEPVKINDL